MLALSHRIERFREIARHFNEDVEILKRVFDSFVREKDYKSAVTVLDRVLQLEPNSSGLDEKQIRDIQALRERLHALALLPSDSSLAPSMRRAGAAIAEGAPPMSTPWYQSGLRFTCTRCGHCGTGEPSFV